VAKSKADEDKLSQGLSRLIAEDPTLRLENNAETRQLVLWCMGEAHADVLLDRLANRYGVAVETTDLRVPLRETIAGKAQGLGRNVKQTGGHGEYGICHIEVEPLEDSAGFEFVDKIVGGVVPRQFIPSVEKGVRWQMEQGVTAGYPMTGVRVTLYDGKAHSVDSSDMAFQKAGRLALRDAVDKAQPTLLEPVDVVCILVPDDYVGAVMSDLSSRRGRVLGTEAFGVARDGLVHAGLPAARAAPVAPGGQGRRRLQAGLRPGLTLRVPARPAPLGGGRRRRRPRFLSSPLGALAPAAPPVTRPRRRAGIRTEQSRPWRPLRSGSDYRNVARVRLLWNECLDREVAGARGAPGPRSGAGGGDRNHGDAPSWWS
jgi:hypothetical protein